MTVYQVDIPYPPPKSLGILVVEDPARYRIGRVLPPACHPGPGK